MRDFFFLFYIVDVWFFCCCNFQYEAVPVRRSQFRLIEYQPKNEAHTEREMMQNHEQLLSHSLNHIKKWLR